MEVEPSSPASCARGSPAAAWTPFARSAPPAPRAWHSGGRGGVRGSAESHASDARSERKRRLAQRCVHRARDARRQRLRAHRIRALTDARSDAQLALQAELGAGAELGLDEAEIAELEAMIAEELYVEEERMLEMEGAYCRERQHEEDMLVEEAAALAGSPAQSGVLCPVCGTQDLGMAGPSTFVCGCGFEADACAGCASLEQLQGRLQHAWANHQSSQCRAGRIEFRGRHGGAQGPRGLDAGCAACGWRATVL